MTNKSKHLDHRVLNPVARSLRSDNPAAADLSGYSKVLDKSLIRHVSERTAEEWERIPEVGPVVARSIYDHFHDKKNVHFLEKLFRNGVIILPYKLQATSYKLTGKSFVLTGTLEKLTREEAEDKIRTLGGKVSSSVSQKTGYVVAGAEPGSKLVKAKKLGVRIIGEKEFLDMLK